MRRLVDEIYSLKDTGKPYDQLLDRAIKAGSIEALFIRAEDLATAGKLEDAMAYYYTAHKHKHPQAAYKCAMACQKKAKHIASSGSEGGGVSSETSGRTREEVNSWYRKSIAFYRDAITLYLMDATIKTRIDESSEEYLYDFFYQTALVATELCETPLAVFCLHAILELQPQVEIERSKRKLKDRANDKRQGKAHLLRKERKKIPQERLQSAKSEEEAKTIADTKKEISGDIMYLSNKLRYRFYPDE